MALTGHRVPDWRAKLTREARCDMQWIVDGSIHLSEICAAHLWREKFCIPALKTAGLSDEDAWVYYIWATGTDAVYQRAVGDENLTDDQYARISVTHSGAKTHPIGPPI